MSLDGGRSHPFSLFSNSAFLNEERAMETRFLAQLRLLGSDQSPFQTVEVAVEDLLDVGGETVTGNNQKGPQSAGLRGFSVIRMCQSPA